MQLTREQVAQMGYQVGFRGQDLIDLVAIAGRESGYNTQAFNGNRSTGDQSYGLMQINMIDSMGPARRAAFGINSNEDLYDPLTNLRAAYQMWQGRGGEFYDWGPYKGLPATYSTDVGAAAAAVENAGNQGLLGQDWQGDTDMPRAGYFTPEGPAPLTPEQREMQEVARKLGNMGHPGWREYATAKPKIVRARRSAIERMLGPKEEKDPEKWAAAARRLGNRGFQRFGPFSTLGEDELKAAQLKRTAQTLGDLGLPKWDEFAKANERQQTLRRQAMREILGKGPHKPKEWMQAATKLGNKGLVRFQPYATLPEKKLERRQEGYAKRQKAEAAREAASQEMTDLLRGLGIRYPNAPEPTPALMAYLRGVGLDLSQARDVKRLSVRRTKQAAREAQSDITTALNRTQRGATSDLARRGVLASGEANTRYGENITDAGERREDVRTARMQNIQNARLGYKQTTQDIRQGAIEQVAQALENQEVKRAAQRAQNRQFRRQTRLNRRLRNQYARAEDERITRLENLYAQYANQGITI